MKAYIISIVGVICLGILLEIVLPEGKTAKYVRGAFSLLIIFVIAQPLPTLLKKDWSAPLDGILSEDSQYVESVYSAYAERMESVAEKALAKKGINAIASVEISPSFEKRIKSVSVFADGDREMISSVVAEALFVSKDVITVFGKS